MGTSASSKGPGSGVPMVPPWVPASAPLPPPQEEEGVNLSAGAGEDSGTPDLDQSKSVAVQLLSAPLIIPVAPPRRFNSARRNLGNFAHTGDTAAMRRGVGQYFRQRLRRRIAGCGSVWRNGFDRKYHIRRTVQHSGWPIGRAR